MKYNQVIQGRWYKINKKIEKKIKSKYHKIKDWVMVQTDGINQFYLMQSLLARL